MIILLEPDCEGLLSIHWQRLTLMNVAGFLLLDIEVVSDFGQSQTRPG